jgi:phospholipid/cholesterol/gamma-HCH transport system substrate-binding protein
MIRSRYMDEWVGLVVVASVIVFLGVALQAGILRDWFKPVSTLRILLPETGVAGLSVGSDVEVLGTRAGRITRIVIDPSQQMHAEAEIDEQATASIRRDSKAVIRKRFGIAGAAYVEIQGREGPELDWSYAVIQAETERAPTETVGALIDEVRAKVFPMLDDAGRAMDSLAVTMERVQRGEGNIGRLLSDETLVRSLETTAAEAQAAAADVRRIIAQLEPAVGGLNELTRTVNAPEGGVPELLRRADRALTSMQTAMDDLSQAAERTPQIALNIESATETLPSLLTQAQQTARELEQALAQLRQSWLFGGNNAEADDQAPVRLSPTEVRP